MKGLSRKFKTVLTMAIAVTALAVVASPASAAVAKFSPLSSNINATTSGLTVKRNGIDARTCTLESNPTSGWVYESILSLDSSGEVWFECSGSSYLQMGIYATAGWDGTRYYLQLPSGNGVSMLSPWGSYSLQASKPTWVNGSGATKSVLKFEKTAIGSAGGTITVDGNLEFTTSTGGLLTLTH